VSDARKDSLFILMLIVAMLFWGGGWTATKLVADDAHILVLSFWRYFVTFLALLPLVVWLKKPVRLSGRAAGITAASALFNTAFMVLSFYGVLYGMAGAAGVMITTLSPILTSLLALVLLRQSLSANQGWGLFLGFLGGAVMLELWLLEPAVIFGGGNAYFLVSALLWSFVTLLSQRSHLHLDPLVYSMVVAGISSAMLLGFAWEHDVLGVLTKGWDFWLPMLYLSLLSQTVATTIYYYASGKLGSGRTSSFMFIVPSSALFFSWLILDEQPTLWLMLGGACSLAAVYLVNRKKRG